MLVAPTGRLAENAAAVPDDSCCHAITMLQMRVSGVDNGFCFGQSNIASDYS